MSMNETLTLDLLMRSHDEASALLVAYFKSDGTLPALLEKLPPLQ